MSVLRDLLRRVEDADPVLAADLAREIRTAGAPRPFGLHFERHMPESVELPGRPVRKGDKVRVLPTRGSAGADQRIWRVQDIQRTTEGAVAHLVRREASNALLATSRHPLGELVVVAESRDPIYPGLIPTGRIERGGEKPFHTVINGENFHALQALVYTHAGKVDAIYIDPPYNSGARDWKYNNDYVDADDAYRHSKWLAYMERRLKVAQRLLKPEASVLIVAIDEKEFLRLGLLLEQTFPGCRVQMVSAVVSPRSTSRASELSRIDEYLFFVFFGAAGIEPAVGGGEDAEVRWLYLRRTQRSLVRGSRPNQFYAIYVDRESQRIVKIGDPMGTADKLEDVEQIPGAVPVFPINPDGQQLIWGLTGPSLQEAIDRGFVRVTEGDEHQPYTIAYLSLPSIRKAEKGEYVIQGTRPDGSKIVTIRGGKRERPSTAWREARHDAGAYGTSLLRTLIPNRAFPFPKSLYAVEDSLRIVIGSKRDAIVVDFFAGSGTTAHAVMRLNHQDGGRRQTVSVTNNEVSADEQTKLRAHGLRPGDPDWDRWGICDYITKPRIRAAVTGVRPEGEPVEGDYKFVDPFPMSEGFSENVEFFTMTYEEPRAIVHHRAFPAIAPLLWLKAGAVGHRIENATATFDVAERYGVLFDLDASQDFIEVITERESVRMAFVITEDDRAFQSICADLPPRVEGVRLYDSYLQSLTFSVN